MNIFEDLIEELKEDNLIEQTVIETSQIEAETKISSDAQSKTEKKSAAANDAKAGDAKFSDAKSSDAKAGDASAETGEFAAEDAEPSSDKTEFYRQRATNEVSFLQMVEAAFAGLEREQLKIVPRAFDDLKVKKVLHSFLQISQDADSPEYGKAEFQLLKETESWYSSLSLRDMRIMTAHLRRYCETSRPPLSSPALVALARFYRNSPYSEQIRSKFDLVVTRLFSKEINASQRTVVFSRRELIVHLQELYADWSSVPLYSTEANDADIAQIAQKFEDFMAEAESATSFDELINSNYFNRLRLFKEHSSENFYAPLVAATAIDCNIRVGNRYVELLEKEKGLGNVAGLEDKYGLSHDQVISEATGKTLSLVELLNEKKAAPEVIEEKNTIVEQVSREEIKISEKSAEKPTDAPVKSKKWMLSAAMLAVILIVGIYFATSSNSDVKVQETTSASKLNLENSILKEYLSEAAIEDSTLNGVVLPTWNHMTGDKKRNVLKQILNIGSEKGYKKVQLTSRESKTVAIAADDGSISIID